MVYVSCSYSCKVSTLFFNIIFLSFFLVKCPEGSYSRNEQCVPCPIGFYQEQAGSMACIPCPAGRTTVAIGAFSQTHCKSYRGFHE
jgi:hypothetical protein